MALVFWWENSVIFILSQYTILQLFKDFILQLCHTRGYFFCAFQYINLLIYTTNIYSALCVGAQYWP